MPFAQIEGILFYGSMALYLVSVIMFFIFFVAHKERFGKLGVSVLLAAFVLHTLCLIARGIATGHVPLTNQYEFSSCFAWGIALCFLCFVRKNRFLLLGTFVAPVIFLVIGYAAMQSRAINELMPALKSNWLAVHVSCAIIGYGSFGVAFGIALMYLLGDRRDKSAFMQAHLPAPEKLDLYSYRAVALGFLFLTLVIITGAIWAERAWGRYWSWDPKETWSLVTWIIYALYLHARLTRGLKGRKAAWFAVIGFVCVIFTYIGVNTFIPSIHSYA